MPRTADKSTDTLEPPLFQFAIPTTHALTGQLSGPDIPLLLRISPDEPSLSAERVLVHGDGFLVA
jgi:hypothetical protein